jgi:hypothetical protein
VFLVHARELAVKNEGVTSLVGLKAGLPWAGVNPIGRAGSLSTALLLRLALALSLGLLNRLVKLPEEMVERVLGSLDMVEGLRKEECHCVGVFWL